MITDKDHKVLPSKSIAILAILLSSLFFSFGVILTRLQAVEFSGPFISLYRFSTGIIFCLGILFYSGKSAWKISTLKYLILRGVFGATGMTLYFAAIEYIGSSRATLFLHTFPIWVAFFGVLIFRNKLRKLEIPAIFLCIIGAVLIFRGPSDFLLIGIVSGLSAGLMRGITVHMVKKSGKSNHPAMVYLSVCLVGLILFPFYGEEFLLISSAGQFFALTIISFCMFVSQLLIAWGLRTLTPTSGSILIYSNIPITLGFGLLIGENLNIMAWLGAGFIITGLILPVLRKRT
jgi:drug/metabolite transporter (DMT)-like permease